MKNTRRETLSMISALCMLAFGASLTTAGFIVPPLGEVHNSVMWILGQVLIYSGSIFGISAYTNQRINEVTTKYHDDSNSGDSPRQ